ncbi:uncharacterized protein N7459_003250 [Penicillium hispanicum]|uniref:uncharacterized protein n=1 Tax=Penicillium hispanicum TaxID=1080232 RepID=UPI00253FE147|nr:uncharacterized protein N7459_003250 [Penicillium hispanicum]KAJ5587485.1 hypothetical protein N7459_003250 [Penicillium hispanicum]
MSRPLHLNTQMGPGQSQRYSFIETPLEMHPAGLHSELSSLPPGSSGANMATPQAAIESPSRVQGQPVQYIPSEKERRLQQEGIIPTYSKYPPPDQHPAYSAPLDEPPIQQAPVPTPQYAYNAYSQHSYHQPPTSPGPLPVKTNPDLPSRSDTMTVAPDANPLQSPKSPYFPPPTAATPSQMAPVDDLSAFHQPGQIMHPNQEVQGGTWHHGLCECSNIGACCLGLTCPCVLYGRTQYRLSMKSRKEDPTNMLGYETCNGSCTGMALLCGCQWLLATIQHTRTRKAYGIHGDIASDCVRATCCTCCILIQDEKEIQTREERRSRAALERGATLLSPYTAPGPMAYAPPPR